MAPRPKLPPVNSFLPPVNNAAVKSPVSGTVLGKEVGATDATDMPEVLPKEVIMPPPAADGPQGFMPPPAMVQKVQKHNNKKMQSVMTVVKEASASAETDILLQSENQATEKATVKATETATVKATEKGTTEQEDTVEHWMDVIKSTSRDLTLQQSDTLSQPALPAYASAAPAPSPELPLKTIVPSTSSAARIQKIAAQKDDLVGPHGLKTKGTQQIAPKKEVKQRRKGKAAFESQVDPSIVSPSTPPLPKEIIMPTPISATDHAATVHPHPGDVDWFPKGIGHVPVMPPTPIVGAVEEALAAIGVPPPIGVAPPSV